MIFFDEPKFIKREEDKIFLISKSINFGVFCDYSESEDLVEIEEPNGERTWTPISLFFWNKPIKKGLYIGLLRNNLVHTYIVKSLEQRQIRKRSFLYANLEYTGVNRPLEKRDFPFNRLSHDLSIPLQSI